MRISLCRSWVVCFVVQAIDRIIALCYDKMCETPVVEIEDDSEDTQEQDGVDDDADVPEPAIARDSVTGGPVPKVQFYCGTERASAASGGRLVIPDIRNPLFHFN